MANSFSKEEIVAFDQVLEGFDDALVLSRTVAKYNVGSTTLERANDTIWRPMPYIVRSNDGTDATGQFKENTQLSVPARLGYQKNVALLMSATELRDAIQEQRLGQAAMQRLSSDINVALMNIAANYGTLFVKRSAAASGFDDLAECEAVFNEQGIPGGERYCALATRHYNGMASNLAGRATMAGKPTTAYEKAYVGNVASFETYKLDYANTKAAAAGGGSLTINTLVAGANFYTPRATSVGADGQASNVDNRFQTVTISSTTSVAAGDAFTIAGVVPVHHITKLPVVGQLKTFRVISVDSATTMTISPPIISAQGETEAEYQYKNVSVTGSATAAIVFLNTVAGAINPFWHREAVELMFGRYAVPRDAGVSVMNTTSDQGVEVVMQKFYDIDTMKTKYRWDIFFGATMLQPQMCGLMMFSQT